MSNMAMRTLILLVALLCACSNRRRSKQEGAPDPGDMLAYCTRGLDTQSHFALELQRDEPGLAVWSLSFDGIPIIGMAASARSAEHWKMQCYPSLHGPEALHADRVIPEFRAEAQARAENRDVHGSMHARLVYYAMQKDVPRFPGATNEMDFDMVIDHYELMLEVKDDHGEGALVRAYTGDVFMKLTNWRS